MDVLLPRMREATYTESERRGNASLPCSRLASPPERARHDLLAALTGLLVGDAEVTGESGFQAIGGVAGHAPATRPPGEFAPVLRVVRDVGRLVDLLDLGGVFDHETVRLDEIGED